MVLSFSPDILQRMLTNCLDDSYYLLSAYCLQPKLYTSSTHKERTYEEIKLCTLDPCMYVYASLGADF